MARTITEINNSIIAAIQADTTLNTKATSTSKVAAWRLFSYIVAVAIWSLEVILDQRNTEVNALLLARKAHTPNWYATKVKDFQYGDTLVDGEDYYPVIDDTKKIITFVAIVEVFDNGLSTLLIKAAKGATTPEVPTTDEQTALNSYLQKIKDAGVYVQPRFAAADVLKPVMKIYYDPQVLQVIDNKLMSISAGTSVVEDAIINYLKNLPFNGELSLNAFIDAIQVLSGISDPFMQSCQVTNTEYPTGTNITDKFIAYSGYFELDALTFDSFTYQAI